MLKIKSILVSLLALGAMASCSTNELDYITYPEGKYLQHGYLPSG